MKRRLLPIGTALLGAVLLTVSFVRRIEQPGKPQALRRFEIGRRP